MLSRALKQLSSYQKRSALQQAIALECQNPRIVDNLVAYDDPDYPNEESYLAVYKCDCGAIIAEDEEVGELGACHKCNANYLGLDEE